MMARKAISEASVTGLSHHREDESLLDRELYRQAEAARLLRLARRGGHKRGRLVTSRCGLSQGCHGISSKESQWPGRTTVKSRWLSVARVTILRRSATVTTLASTRPRLRSA